MSKFYLTFAFKKGLIVESSKDKYCEDMQEVANAIVECMKEVEGKEIDGINISLKKNFKAEDGKDVYIEVVDKNIYNENDLWIDYKDELSGMIGQITQQLWLAKNQDKLKLMQGGMMGMPGAMNKTTESGLIL